MKSFDFTSAADAPFRAACPFTTELLWQARDQLAVRWGLVWRPAQEEALEAENPGVVGTLWSSIVHASESASLQLPDASRNHQKSFQLLDLSCFSRKKNECLHIKVETKKHYVKTWLYRAFQAVAGLCSSEVFQIRSLGKRFCRPNYPGTVSCHSHFM